MNRNILIRPPVLRFTTVDVQHRIDPRDAVGRARHINKTAVSNLVERKALKNALRANWVGIREFIQEHGINRVKLLDDGRIHLEGIPQSSHRPWLILG